MRNTASIAAAALAFMAVPATAHAQTATAPQPAQATAQPAAGATVYDAQGNEVGKIESVANGAAVVFTGTSRAAIPLTSFGTSPKGPTLGMTKAELDAASQSSAATQVRSQLTPGAEVRGQNGAVLGKVKAIEGDNVIVTAASGNAEARVPLSGFGVNAQGVFIGMSQAQFDAAIGASAGAATPGTAAQ
jgi:Cu/Zn superoxide dismutase